MRTVNEIAEDREIREEIMERRRIGAEALRRKLREAGGVTKIPRAGWMIDLGEIEALDRLLAVLP